MKIIAEYVVDGTYIIKEKSYGERFCRIELTSEMIERLSKYGIDGEYVARKLADQIEQIFYNAQYRPTAMILSSLNAEAMRP